MRIWKEAFRGSGTTVWASAQQGEKWLPEKKREKDSGIEAGTEQMTNLTCFMVLQRWALKVTE